MKLNLTRDLCFFDLESTGLNVIRDRIIQIAIIKYFAKGREPEELSMLINPGIPISEEAMRVHGITPKDVANKPTFVQVAQKIYDFIGNADLAGYNSNRFDVPMLQEEFARAGIDFDIDHRRMIDIQRIFYKMEPRNLRAAVRFYCDKDLENAHDALADVKATIDVFEGQLRRYEGQDYEDDDGKVFVNPIRNDMQAVFEFTKDEKVLDITQRLRLTPEGEVVFNFGKYVGRPVAQTLVEDKQYYHWILNKEFSVQVKKLVKKLVQEYEQQQRENNPPK
ncbi:MAG: 3'-5' exonuclease [Saprospirales bacterium]|nr:3'-5' exonuclease [Saprospirales bacterium]MBK7336528.1 3'-5' exonuclease [Saprospirales bacterium]